MPTSANIEHLQKKGSERRGWGIAPGDVKMGVKRGSTVFYEFSFCDSLGDFINS